MSEKLSLTGNWNYPTNVRFGAGRIAELAECCKSLGMTRPLLVTDPGLADRDIIKDAAAANTADAADGIFLSCANWRSMSVAVRIEGETGKPVVTSNQATVWATRHRLGFADPVAGYGQLLQQAPAEAALAAE